MTALTALARAQAVVADIAQPIATVRHLHLSDRPMVFVPLTMAGEANAPLAALVGDDPDRPRLLVVPQPRDRQLRFAFAAELAGALVPYLDAHRGGTEPVVVDRGRDVRLRYTDAPQVLVPNRGGVEFVRLFGRSTRFRRTDGDYPVDPSVPLLGRWLTHLAERAEYPGSSTLVAMTEALGTHWATGQSALEDANLAALLAWIDPPGGRGAAAAASPGGRGAAAAARAAEDPSIWPPAGPVTDPGFDADVLAPLIARYEATLAAGGDDAPARAAIEAALRGQLAPTWQLMWRGVRLLRALSPGARVAGRWAADRDAYTEFTARLDEGAPPQPRRDGAVVAARRLHRLERALDVVTAQRAFDDPLVMAEYRLTGEAFLGTVTAVDRLRLDTSGARPVLRPYLTVVTEDPVRVGTGVALTAATRPGQTATVVAVTSAEGTSAEGAAGAGTKTEVLLELSGGMGRGKVPAQGSVPDVGDLVCYTTLSEGYVPPGAFPTVEETPWTHGGPPVGWAPEPSAGDGPDSGGPDAGGPDAAGSAAAGPQLGGPELGDPDEEWS